MLLAFDTATPHVTVALHDGERVVAEFESTEAMRHGEMLAPGIEQVLREVLVEGLGIKPRFAFTPLRVAISGRRISPPLFESMELLGREAVLARIERLAASV